MLRPWQFNNKMQQFTTFDLDKKYYYQRYMYKYFQGSVSFSPQVTSSNCIHNMRPVRYGSLTGTEVTSSRPA